VTRIFNTYGPRTHPNDGRVISSFIVQALLGRELTVFGEGRQTRSFCFVDDLIEGFVRLMGSAEEVTVPINLGSPGEVTILELAQLILDLTRSKSKIAHRTLPQDDPKQRRPDIEQAKDVLRLVPKVPLREGLTMYFEQLLKEVGVDRISNYTWKDAAYAQFAG
jgi:UDP-glucuronate decarboxylase